MKKLFFDKTLTFFLLLVVITCVFLYISYNISSKGYSKLENEQNNKNIENFIYTIENKYSVKSLTNKSNIEDIEKICSKFFEQCSINSETTTQTKLKVSTNIDESMILNNINFYDDNNKFLFQIQTKSNQKLMNNGKSNIKIFSSIVLFFLILTILISRTFQKHMNQINEDLEEKVEKRTKQINHTMKELEKANLKLYDLAHTDYLTQVKNRRSFFLHADSLFDKLQKSNDVISIIMIDIDNFKSFNDTYGHEVGDKILKLFAKAIKEVLLKDQIFGRLGGEEFAIALPHTNLENALKIAENIRKKVERIVINIPSTKLFITASFGVSDSIDTKSIDEIIKNADKMLYDAKKKGKNRVRSRLS